MALSAEGTARISGEMDGAFLTLLKWAALLVYRRRFLPGARNRIGTCREFMDSLNGVSLSAGESSGLLTTSGSACVGSLGVI
jgi:hypothetical protein